MTRMAILFVALLAFSSISSAQTADQPQETPVALQRLLIGTWQGPACVGVLTFAADGAFERQHYTPGNNTLAGVWKVRWNASPPTLVLTCQTLGAPDRLPVGAVTEVKLIQLDEETLAYEYPQYPGPVRDTQLIK